MIDGASVCVFDNDECAKFVAGNRNINDHGSLSLPAKTEVWIHVHVKRQNIAG